jgi:ribonuclease D
MNVLEASDINCYHGDIPGEYLRVVYDAGVVAWDIETSGLDWKTEKIGTCQLYVPGGSPVLVSIGSDTPANLCILLAEPRIKKIFHHATFDLRFMSYNWGVLPQNIACTKIAAKLLNPGNNSRNSLKPLLEQYFNISIDKTSQRSDWLATHLSDAQVRYAATDVYYLPALLTALEQDLSARGLLELARACFMHIPTQAQLDLLGYKGLYDY